METLELLLGTVWLRPYVFVFMAFYLAVAILNMGSTRTVIFTVLAYGIAFLAEYSSTRNGFPFGFYSYIETTRGQELWISNVPLMTSLSFSFLAYISFTLSLLLWSALIKKGWDIRLDEKPEISNSLRVIFTGAILFMLLDMIIDPVAFRGDRWFLGKIYTYKEKGEYFNIPLTNFAGWLVVGTAILFCFSRINRILTRHYPVPKYSVPYQALLGPGMYFGVLIFNLAVTFYIGEILLGFCGVALMLAILTPVIYKIKQ